ncbi:phytanoyl-CoA dioxygenase family protein [Paenibacillus ginsengarvi]|uniref:Phytanoyl-CoA dioxygenase family protein n=1 Tax=Paenibacillus ginsengarvi TaxID=400777 RepID=A0A3B0C9B9_9BACL|nr:phytanoyl-CoA dioxygenase family protein [Paenibacillus ginsengarvi]RKN80689.1 phytanoyl-CoA dioxygenase family protein [Paenibacillus ginsengarvi]
MTTETTHELLSEQQIQFYRENGFVQIDNVLTPEELAELREYLDEAMTDEDGNSFATDKQGGSYYRVLNQKVNTWRDHGGMAKYVLHPRFAELARRLTGASAIRLFHDHALFKMPGDSKPTPWHQDMPYWPMNEKGALSIWITLDDVDENNGCMMFVPGSFKAGKLKGINFLDPQNINDYVEDPEIAATQPVIVRMKAGSCTFHDGLTFHYAHSNKTDKPRRVLAIIYMPDGTTFNGKNHLLTTKEKLTQDKPISGRLFPVLSRE